MGKYYLQARSFSSLRFFSTITSSELVKSDEIVRFCLRGHVKQAFENFKSQLWKDPSLFSHLLQSCTRQKSLSLGKQIHSLIITSGCSSNKFISNHLLNMYSKLGELNTALSLYGVMPKRNIMSCNILINGYAQRGDFEGARKVFDEMPDKNVATWNAMITGLVQFEFNEEGLGLFKSMRGFEFLLPDEFCLGSVLRGCAGLRALDLGQQVHVYVIKCGLEVNLIVGCSLAHMYMKCRSLEAGAKVIRLLPVQNVIAWNTLIAGNAQNGYPEGVLNLFNMMKKAGLRPDNVTFVSVLSSCSDLATLGQGQQVHAETVKAGAKSVMAVVSSLISLYSRCGYLEDSVKVFSEREGSDSVVWSSMITAYGFHGHAENAIRLFECMQQEWEVSDITFLSLLYACSHSGLKEKGTEFFSLMIEKYGLKPRLEHYTCMVDLLGRCGCLDEAETMIRSMPVKPDAVLWKTFLSACKTHNKVDIARRIAEEIIKLDPEDASSYVLLSNIHASAKKWQDVSELRKAMRDRNVRKEPGISWLELKNQIHQFCMGDKSHSQSTEIDLYLKELIAEMKLQGYVPDTSCVLHDMENEEKEYSLTHHSEKLVIAFALMNVPEGVPIRIMKNLRVCNDCHVAIKYISKIKNREVIVRDSSRFHHFKEGRCSCGDYW